MLRHLAAAAALAALLGGLPWGLAALIGWPLPDHIPTWTDVQAVLMAPMAATFVLDVLACGCWVLWGLFTASVARSALDVVRHDRMTDPRTSGPIRRIAAVLVSTVLVSILGPRAAFAANNHSTSTPVARADMIATASAGPNAGAGTGTYAALDRGMPPSGSAAPVTARSVTVLAPDPNTGVHDSLWRIAERTLGDGARWPEIFALNKDKPQPGGRTLTRPSLIYPGETLRLPTNAIPAPTSPVPTPAPGSVADAPDRAPGTPVPASSEPPLPSSSSAPMPADTDEAPRPTVTVDAPTSAPTTAQETSGAAGEPGIRWGEDVFVGLGFAAAVSAAFVVARRRQRRRYRPGSGDRSDLSVAPAVYQLRLAHLRARKDRGPSQEVDESETALAPGTTTLGVRDGRQIALDLAAAHGLGLIGPGAAAAVRALVVSVLAATPRPARHATRVIVPVADCAVLHGQTPDRAPLELPACLHVAADLNAALDALEAEILVRAGSPRNSRDGGPPLLLIARTPDRERHRLQAVLDNGSAVGVTGLLLGQWLPGATAYVRENGSISTTSPGVGETLRGTHVYRLGIEDTAELLTLLYDADPGHDDDLQSADTEQDTDAFAPGDGRADHDPQETGLEIVEDAPAPLPRGRPSPSPPEHDTEPTPSTTKTITETAETSATAEHDRSATRFEVGRRTRTGDTTSPPAPLRISVLGPPRVWLRTTSTAPGSPRQEPAEREITRAFQPRVRELLVFLALHPDGANREALIAALWATNPPEKTTNALNTSLTRLRRALAAATEGTVLDVVLAGDSRYRLDAELVEVDYHHFAAAVAARRAAVTDVDRVEAYRRIVDSYTGPLADGLSTDWIETAREAIRRDAIDAVAALARALVEDDPQQTLDLLEIARSFDPHNELIYRDIMRLQERLGQLDAIPRTLTLLATRLAEVDDRPTHQAVELADRLRRRHDVPGEPGRADRGRSRAG